MANSIFHLDGSGKLSEMNQQGFVAENVLQQLLADYPNLIPGAQINSELPRRWLLVSREIGVPDKESGSARWSLDHLFIDQDGIPTLVEVKRSTDTRIRREVIGQILDYAANAVTYWSIDEIKNQFVLNCQNQGEDSERVLNDFLDGTSEISQFWELVLTNLRAGKIRMILLADEIPSEMLRIIEFLNGQMNPAEVLGVEVRQFAGSNMKTLVPKVVGVTVAAQAQKSIRDAGYRKWDESSFFDELGRHVDQSQVRVARKLFEWAKPRVTRVWFGEGSAMGSFVPILHAEKDHQLFAVWTYGAVEIYFQHFLKKRPFDSEEMRVQLMERLNAIPGIEISVDKLTKRPSFQLSVLASESAFSTFVNTFEWFLEQVRSAYRMEH